ncbi:MAG: TetR/AcrR family transcriptional regulator, partial [Ruminococcus sp.]|nr:TetR/AcrR family transcriptional regulator [Candidatus Copronaster equi]
SGKMSKIIDNKFNKMSKILDAAYELFTSKSFNNTSIDDVVKKAGIAKGTFYLYFKDKHDLMDRLVAKKSSAVFKHSLDKLKAEKEKNKMMFDEQIVFLADSVVDYMQSHKEMIILLEKKFSYCVKSVSHTDDVELKNDFDELINENVKNGFSAEETMKRIYIIIDMVGSVCCDAILFESPFKLDEIKPVLFSSIRKIVS